MFVFGVNLESKTMSECEVASKGLSEASEINKGNKTGKFLFGGMNAIVAFDTHLPLSERLLRIDHIQARRYSKLTGVAYEIATEGIIRHLRACDRMDVNPETSAVREIIDDALNGRRVFAETTEHPRAA
jgi:hypothetical protein